MIIGQGQLNKVLFDDEQEYPHSFDNYEHNTHNLFEIKGYLGFKIND